MRIRLAMALALVPALAAAQGIPVKDQNTSRAADIETCGSAGGLNCINVDTGQTTSAAGFARMADDLGRALMIGDPSIRALAVSSTRTDYANQNEGAALDARILNSATTT